MSLKNTDVRTPGIAAIAKKWNLPVAHVARLVDIGAKTEHEHNKNLSKARQVARDHIAERPDYYQKLKKMEKSPVSVKEMDMSGMPMSKNIEDRRDSERKENDAALKPGQDVGTIKGSSYSIMKSSPSEYNMRSAVIDRNAPYEKKPFTNDSSSLTPHQRLDKSYWSEPVKAIKNKPELEISEETGVGAIRGLGYVSGDPAVDPISQYIDTNAMLYQDQNGNILKLIKKNGKENTLGFTSYNPTQDHGDVKQRILGRKIMKESRLDELSGGDSRDYEGGVSGLPKSAYRYDDIKEGKRLEKVKKAVRQVAGGTMVAANLVTLGQVAGDAAEGRGSPKRSIIAAATAKPGMPGLVASGAHYGLKVKDFMRRKKLEEIKATTVGNAQAFAAAKRKELTSKGHLSQDDVKKWWKYERFVKSAGDKLSGRTKVPPTLDDNVSSKGKKKETKNG